MNARLRARLAARDGAWLHRPSYVLTLSCAVPLCRAMPAIVYPSAWSKWGRPCAHVALCAPHFDAMQAERGPQLRALARRITRACRRQPSPDAADARRAAEAVAQLIAGWARVQP